MINVCISNQPLQGVSDIPTQRALEIDITYACGMGCMQCNRALGMFPSSERMTLNQIERVLEESLSLPTPYRQIRVLGGEPALHPDLFDIVRILGDYSGQVEKCEISVWTSGVGEEIQQKLLRLPSWVSVRVSFPKVGVGRERFEPFLVAPIDYPSYHDKDYYNGCEQIAPGKCGVGVSVYGVYVCPVAAAIDRIVGLDIGIKTLVKISNKVFRQQCEQLCRYCGHFLYDRGARFDLKMISATWRALSSNYEKHIPLLKQY